MNLFDELKQNQKIKEILAKVNEWESSDKSEFIKELLPLLTKEQIDSIHSQQVKQNWPLRGYSRSDKKE